MNQILSTSVPTGGKKKKRNSNPADGKICNQGIFNYIINIWNIYDRNILIWNLSKHTRKSKHKTKSNNNSLKV